MAYSEVEFWVGNSLKMMFLEWRYVGFVKVARITDRQQRQGIYAVHIAEAYMDCGRP